MFLFAILASELGMRVRLWLKWSVINKWASRLSQGFVLTLQQNGAPLLWIGGDSAGRKFVPWILSKFRRTIARLSNSMRLLGAFHRNVMGHLALTIIQLRRVEEFHWIFSKPISSFAWTRMRNICISVYL
jgi:hypothetical protein